MSRVSGEFSGAVTNGCARVIENKRDPRLEFCVIALIETCTSVFKGDKNAENLG